MIDYTKIRLLGINPTSILDNNCFEFKTVVFRNGGQIHKHVAEYHFCKITVYEYGLILFTGSIHKMFNSIKGINAPNYNPKSKEQYKGFNGNQFTLSNIIYVRDHLRRLFKCESNQMVFQNIEFGINTTPMIDQLSFLPGLLYHKGKRFESKFNGNFYYCEHQQYRIKIYNKSEQYGMLTPTTRIEMSLKKSNKINKLGIYTFADINIKTLENAKIELLRQFDEVVYYDYTIRKCGISKPLQIRLNKYANLQFWLKDLKPHHRDRHKKKLQETIIKYSENLKAKFTIDILKKCVTINRLESTEMCNH
ncbi:hypothetical protein [Gramella sp. MAR_2010_147]|uniref:hypothetical protein n=1 Tax=Gramella sp. MAR_2010_147 TaxID=1250205 RepID=UPI00087A776C|nr:hypothetical protein [Gramella sp. MAR_2010_147]SDS13396.1 hypothetical protein SAMN04488553_1551 [Gramella sp. MAR_2010_147]